MLRLKHHQTTHSSRDRVLARPSVFLPTPRHLVVRDSSSNGGSNGHGAGVDSIAQLGSISQAPNPYNWSFDSTRPAKPAPKVQDIPVAAIRRPLGRTRSNGERGHECVGFSAGVGGDCGSCSAVIVLQGVRSLPKFNLDHPGQGTAVTCSSALLAALWQSTHSTIGIWQPQATLWATAAHPDVSSSTHWHRCRSSRCRSHWPLARSLLQPSTILLPRLHACSVGTCTAVLSWLAPQQRMHPASPAGTSVAKAAVCLCPPPNMNFKLSACTLSEHQCCLRVTAASEGLPTS